MKEDIKQLWIKALRSGKFIQTEGCLHNNNGYCCLGILCELYYEATNRGAWVEKNGGIGEESTGVFEFLYKDELLPAEVLEWAGLSEENPYLIDPSGTHLILSHLNDAGLDFKQIADKIETATYIA